MSEKQHNIFSTMLIIVGENVDPDWVTKRLGLRPNKVWRQGERKSFKRKDGSTRYFESLNEEGGWKKWLSASQTKKSLSLQVLHWCSILKNKRRVLQGFRKMGYKTILDFFIAASSQESFNVRPDIQKALASLDLELDITFSAEE